MSDLIKAAKLWARTSQKTGRSYLTGRWGGCRVLVFENTEEGEGQPSHFLFIGDAEAGQERDPARRAQARRPEAEQEGELRSGPEPSARRTAAAPTDQAAQPVERGSGWRGSQYRRPAAARPGAPAADDAPFYDDDLSGIGR